VFAGELVEAQNGIITWVISVMAGRAVAYTVALSEGQIIGDRDRFAVRNQKPVIGALKRRPAADTRGSARPQKIDRCATAEIVPPSILREVPFMGTPAKLRRLRALADKPVDRPSVDEFPWSLRDRRDLSIPFGNMDDLDPQLFGQQAPIVAPSWGGSAQPRCPGEVDQRLLNKMR